MRTIVTFVVFVLALSLVFGGMTNSVFAQNEPSILLKIAKGAEEQIQNQISANSPEEIKNLFEEGKNEVKSLEESLLKEDLNSAKQHFLSAMKIFTETTRELNYQSSHTESTTNQTIRKNTSTDLLRLQSYVINLKSIAKNQNATTDFSNVDKLFSDARNQINKSQFDGALATINEIKNTIIEINRDLQQNASQQQQNRAQSFAQKYLDQLDRLIDLSQKTGKSEDIIQKLQIAKENLMTATTPSDIIKEVRNIMQIQQQFDLSEGKLLELRITQIEKSFLELSNSTDLNPDTIQQMNQNIELVKDQASKNKFIEANETLKSLSLILEQIQN